MRILAPMSPARAGILPRAARALLATLLLVLAPSPAAAAPKAALWPFWAKANNSNAATIDHSPWQRFLSTYVVRGGDGVNRVRYGAVSAADKQALAAYVKRLAATKIRSYRRAEQKAYWINLYNALTLQVVLQRWPVSSIRKINISPGLFARGPWGKKLLVIEGQKVSLDDIEHRILRPIWKDPRIHYAVNCASIGCPNLSRQAYRADRMEAMLNQGARAYVNHPRGVTIDKGRLVVSSIYDWFAADFGGNDRAVIAHLQRYAAPALKAKLANITRIASDRYSWRINSAR